MTKKPTARNRAAFLAGYNTRAEEQEKAELLAVDVLHAVQAYAAQDDRGVERGHLIVGEAIYTLHDRARRHRLNRGDA